ncbi:MAG TPA: hypothetical protein VHM92_04215 [Allosphingosinicella sp.]|nr:hypothetical protein [Allosphingosinicella sp.]
MPVTITTGAKERAERIPSTIQFPYSDITDGISVAEGLLKGGGLPLSRDQLGAAMGLVPNTGSFNTKVSTARTFGVMDAVAGKYQLTDLGFEITDPGRQREALIKAFLHVELYRRVYEEFKGKRLPPRPHGLEQAFIKMGVSPKQAKNARLAFEKSARIAGFYPNGDEDRLVMPFGPGTITAEDWANAEVETIPAPAPPPSAPAASKVLEYELVDLLKSEGIGEAESEAIWTLVRFLTARKKGG